MIRITTLFLVLTVTGLPSIGPLCIAWCEGRAGSVASAAGCHHQTTTNGAPVALTGIQGCEASVQYMPFVREEVQPVSSGWMPSHAAIRTELEPGSPFLEAAAGAAAVSDVPAPPTSITILRL